MSLPFESIREYAQRVVAANPAIDGVYLIGSTAAKGQGNDVDLLYDFGHIELGLYPEQTIEDLLDAQHELDFDSYDTFVKAGDRFFHLSMGAGRGIVENTEYALEQRGKPMIKLASKTADLKPSKAWDRIKRDFYAGIVYHGTTVAIAEEIMKNGFRGLNYDQILQDVLTLYGKTWDDISNTYKKIIRENKNSYSHEFDTISTTPAGEVSLRFAGQGGEVPHAVERFILESIEDLKPGQSRISGEPAVVMCRIKDFENTPFYKRVDQWMKGLEGLAADGGITGNFDLDEAAEDAWTHYTNFNCTPDQLEPIRVLTGGALDLLREGPLPEGKLAKKFAKMAKEEIKPSKNASTQINLPKELAHKIQAITKKVIDPADLMGDGFEDESHITVKYGVEENEDGLIEVVRGLAPFEVRFGKTHTFEPSKSSDGAAPVVIEIDCPELHELHTAVADKIGNRPDDFEYKPHATLAYVKPEAASKYDGLDIFEDVGFEADNITLSKKDRLQITIPFGQSKTASAESTSSLTMAANVEGFPPVVIVRWPQRGMRWRNVLKIVKQIAAEIAGQRVPWRGIRVYESPWGTFTEQQEKFPEWAQKQKFVMYDILEDGTYVSVGKPVVTEQTKLSAEHIENKGGYYWVCVCGNTWYDDGFQPCTKEGERIGGAFPVFPPENPYYICNRCDRWFRTNNLKVIGMKNRDQESFLNQDDVGFTFVGKVAERRKVKEDHGDWTCICGNQPHLEGFFPCNREGEEIDPSDEAGWEGLYVCDRCGRMIDSETRKIVGQKGQGDLFGKSAAERIKGRPHPRKQDSWLFNNDWVCVCGNTDDNLADGRSFYTCDAGGEFIPGRSSKYVNGKYHLVRCAQCGRIIDSDTMRVVGQAFNDLWGDVTPVSKKRMEASHKETPLSDTEFINPEIGQEMNAYADMPEKVRGDEKMPPLEELAPDMFKQASVLPDLDQSIRWNYVNFGQDFEPHLGEFVDWGEVEPLAKADAEAMGKQWDQLDDQEQYEFAYHGAVERTVRPCCTSVQWPIPADGLSGDHTARRHHTRHTGHEGIRR